MPYYVEVLSALAIHDPFNNIMVRQARERAKIIPRCYMFVN